MAKRPIRVLAKSLHTNENIPVEGIEAAFLAGELMAEWAAEGYAFCKRTESPIAWHLDNDFFEEDEPLDKLQGILDSDAEDVVTEPPPGAPPRTQVSPTSDPEPKSAMERLREMREER